MGRSPLVQRYRDTPAGRPCAVCYKPVTKLGSLCEVHRERRLRYGHHSMTHFNLMLKREWLAVMPYVRTYLREHPPTKDQLASAGRLILPGSPPDRALAKQHPRRLLYREQLWWLEAGSRKNPRHV